MGVFNCTHGSFLNQTERFLNSLVPTNDRSPPVVGFCVVNVLKCILSSEVPAVRHASST